MFTLAVGKSFAKRSAKGDAHEQERITRPTEGGTRAVDD